MTPSDWSEPSGSDGIGSDGTGGDGTGGDGTGSGGTGSDGNGKGGTGRGGTGSEGIGDDGTAGDDHVRRSHPLRNWRPPLLTVVGMSLSVALVALFDPNPGPLVLTAALSMTIARNRLVTTWRGRLEALVLLPVVGLATAGVAYLFVYLPVVAAVAYVGALFLSIWLRQFGANWQRIGSLIALPFITLLIAPGGGAGTTPAAVALISVGVLVVVVAVRLLAELTRFIPRPDKPPVVLVDADGAVVSDGVNGPSTAAATRTPRASSPSTTRPIASTRMAIQMAIALAAAFVVGWFVFPQHVSWVVLTAFIVCSGNRGRADVLYKSGLRIVGATAGTVIASLGLTLTSAVHISGGHSPLQGPTLVVVLLVIIAIGLWLREWTYAAWAVAMTLVITLLQGALPSAHGVGVAEGGQLWIRILAIIVGAACGLAASWFVLPVRSESVVRKRIADALAALWDFAENRDPIADHDLTVSLERLDEIGAPYAAWERISGWRKTLRKPGQWMELVHESSHIVRATPKLTSGQRRALADARRSMRDPEAIGPALLAFRDELQTR